MKLSFIFSALQLAVSAALFAQSLPAPWDYLIQASEREIALGIHYTRYTADIDSRFSTFRVTAGSWSTHQEAVVALARLAYPPLPLSIEEFEGKYRIASSPLATEELAMLIAAHLKYFGSSGATTVYDGLENPDALGPLCIHVLEVAPGAGEIIPVRAMDEGVGLETVSSLCRRNAALAGVNGGYFRTGGTYRGESDGVYKRHGIWFSEHRVTRTALGWNPQVGPAGLLMGQLQLQVSLLIAGEKEEFPLQGINRPRDRKDAILFTPEFHRTTLTEAGGLEIEIRQGKVTGLFEGRGSSPIPSDGFVISADGEAADRLRSLIHKSSRIEPRFRVVAMDPSQNHHWEACRNIIGGGPRLLAGGQPGWENEPEKNNLAFFFKRHPRTAIGYRKEGTLVLVVVDGRQWRDSLGLTIPQMSSLMRSLGCMEALNLDGGGSSALVITGGLVNHPSDPTGERADSDALLVFARRPSK
jgi:hypothetical protein